MRSVLFVRTDRLGETLLNLPVLTALRQASPQTHLTVMVQAALRELLDGHPAISVLVTEPPQRGPWWWRAWRLARLWRSWKPDVVILSNPTKTYHLASRLAGIPCRIGYDRKWAWALTHRLPDRKAQQARHEIEYNCELLRPLGITPPTDPVLELPLADQARSRIGHRLRAAEVAPSDALIAIHPWSSNPHKRWPIDRFGQLMAAIVRNAMGRVVVVGQPISHHDRIAWPAEVMDWSGQTSLPELAAVLHRAQVVVSNDSGPIHLAAAVGTPVVALFGTMEPGSHPARWRPWGARHRVIRKSLADVSVEEVLEAVRSVLAEVAASPQRGRASWAEAIRVESLP